MEYSELLELAEKEQKSQKPIRVHCCTSTGCVASNSLGVKDQMDAAVKAAGLEERV